MTGMNDLVRGVRGAKKFASKQNKIEKPGASSSAKSRFWLLLVLVGVISLWVVAQLLQWSRLFSFSEVQTVLFVPKTIEQHGVILVRFHAEPPKVEILSLDPNAQLEILGGYGQYRLQAAYPLLDLKEENNDRFIRAVLGLSLGTVLDEIVVIPQGDINPQSDREAKQFIGRLIRNSQVKIPGKQRLQWGGLVWDGRTTWFFSQYEAKLEDLNTQFDPVLSLEKGEGSCSVTIINTTGISGLAARVDALLREDAISVVRTINSEEKLDETVLLFPKNNQQPSCERVRNKLEKIVPHQLKEERVAEEVLLEERADVVIKLGRDLAG